MQKYSISYVFLMQKKELRSLHGNRFLFIISYNFARIGPLKQLQDFHINSAFPGAGFTRELAATRLTVRLVGN